MSRTFTREIENLLSFSVFPCVLNYLYNWKWEQSYHMDRMLVWTTLIHIHNYENKQPITDGQGEYGRLETSTCKRIRTIISNIALYSTIQWLSLLHSAFYNGHIQPSTSFSFNIPNTSAVFQNFLNVYMDFVGRVSVNRIGIQIVQLMLQ